MARINLKSGQVGMSNINQDHYLRNHSMSINGNDINELIASRLGTSTRVNPNAINEVALKTAGLSANSQGVAYLEDGWGVSRGVALLKFEIENGGIVSNTLGVYGYLYGGTEIMPGYPIPDDITFVPTRSWLIETTGVQDAHGIINKNNVLRQAGQFLLNDPRSPEGSYSIRPVDVVSNSLCLTTDIMEQQLNPIGGGGDPLNTTMAGVTEGIISTQGVVHTGADNNSPVNYGRKLLESAMTATLCRQNNLQVYDALSEAVTNPGIKEVPYFDNAFFRTMMSQLGRPSLAGFQGFSFGEIRSVFPTFDMPGVMNTTLTDASRMSVEDFRINTDAQNGADYPTIIANDVLFGAISILDEARLTYMQVRMSNNTPAGQININNLPVEYQLGECAPLMDEDDGWGYNVVPAVERLAWHIYSKYNSAYHHERRLVNIEAELSFFGESRIAVYVDGNPATERVFNFLTAAGNRIDPTVTTMNGMQQQTFGFYGQLKDQLGII